MFQRVLEDLPDGVVLVDTERRILFWNKAAERITGYSREEWVAQRVQADPVDHTARRGGQPGTTVCPLSAAIEEGSSYQGRAVIHRQDGQRVVVDVHVMPVSSEDGTIAGALEVFRDASAWVALERAYEQVRMLAEEDPLTGLANRRTLDLALERQV
ncbi:MAG: PAS domain-containing protein, partial [Isosphaeraceae bacterium]